jgi:hypothetical protein
MLSQLPLPRNENCLPEFMGVLAFLIISCERGWIDESRGRILASVTESGGCEKSKGRT